MALTARVEEFFDIERSLTGTHPWFALPPVKVTELAIPVFSGAFPRQLTMDSRTRYVRFHSAIPLIMLVSTGIDVDPAATPLASWLELAREKGTLIGGTGTFSSSNVEHIESTPDIFSVPQRDGVQNRLALFSGAPPKHLTTAPTYTGTGNDAVLSVPATAKVALPTPYQGNPSSNEVEEVGLHGAVLVDGQADDDGNWREYRTTHIVSGQFQFRRAEGELPPAFTTPARSISVHRVSHTGRPDVPYAWDRALP